MDFWFMVSQSVTLFASPIMIEVLFSRQLNRKQLIIWNCLLVVVSIIGMNLQYEGSEIDVILSFFPIAMLSTLSLNVVLARKFLELSWSLSFVLSCLSTSLYRAVYAVVGNIIDHVLHGRLGWKNDYTDTTPLYALYRFVLALLVYVCILLLALNIRKRTERNNLLGILINYPASVTDIVLCIYLLVFIHTIGRLFILDNTLIYAIAATIGVSAAVYLFCRSTMLTRKKNIEQQIYFENLKQYRDSVESANQEVLSFRKEYKDILLEIDHYLVTEDSSGLRAYYEETISISDYELNNYTKKLGTISNIKEDFIKGILFSKQREAQQRNITCTIKVLEPFQADTKEPIKIIRILGNLLDNAIEAAEITREKKIDIVFFIDEEGQRKIIISNSRQPEAMNVAELHQRGKTLKENHSGIGLANIAKLADSHLQVEFKIMEEQFVSIITIC